MGFIFFSSKDFVKKKKKSSNRIWILKGFLTPENDTISGINENNVIFLPYSIPSSRQTTSHNIMTKFKPLVFHTNYFKNNKYNLFVHFLHKTLIIGQLHHPYIKF